MPPTNRQKAYPKLFIIYLLINRIKIRTNT